MHWKKLALPLAAAVIAAACDTETPSAPLAPQLNEVSTQLSMMQYVAAGKPRVSEDLTANATPDLDMTALASTANPALNRALFLQNVNVAFTADFEQFGGGFHSPGANWTNAGVTYTTPDNLIVGVNTGYNGVSAVFCYNQWSPVTGTVAPGYNTFAIDVGILGFVSPVNITINTNQNVYHFNNQSVAHWSAGGTFFGFTAANAGEYVTSFVVATHAGTGSGSAGCLDNVVVGNAITNTAPTADAGADQTVNLSGSTTTSVQLDGSASTDDGEIQALTYTWSENSNTIATGATPSVTLGLGTHAITLTVNDGEFTATDVVIINVVDPTPPVIASSVVGTSGTNGWYTSNVAVSWTVTDLESSVTTSGCAAQTVSADTNGVSYECSAQSAGGSASESVSVKRDATVPVIAFAGNAGAYTVDQQITITCSATDAMSGVATSSCPQVSSAAYAVGVGAHSLGATATDGAGNTNAVTATFTVTATDASVCELVKRWVDNQGVANSLCVKLQHGSYAAFINELEALRGKKISTTNANILIGLAQAL